MDRSHRDHPEWPVDPPLALKRWAPLCIAVALLVAVLFALPALLG